MWPLLSPNLDAILESLGHARVPQYPVDDALRAKDDCDVRLRAVAPIEDEAGSKNAASDGSTCLPGARYPGTSILENIRWLLPISC
jgi:hypothetical protein